MHREGTKCIIRGARVKGQLPRTRGALPKEGRVDLI